MVPTRVTRLIIVGRGLLLLAAVVAFLSAALINRRSSVTPAAARDDYACPMHPSVTSPAQADCPICGMPLVPATRRSSSDATSLAGKRQSPEALWLPSQPQVPHAYRPMVGAIREITVTIAPHLPAVVSAVTGTDMRLVAVVHPEELASLLRNEAGRFTPSIAGGRATAIRLSLDASEERDDGMALVRFRVERSDARLRPGTPGWIDLPGRRRMVLVIPTSALIESPDGPYILASSADRQTFTKRPVVVGSSLSYYTILLSGAQVGDLVVVMEAFFLNAELRLRTGALLHDLGEALP